MRKVGILAGTFDPVHEGHLAFGLAAQSVYGLDTVVFLPEGQPRNKDNVTPLKERLQILEVVLKPYPNLIALKLNDKQFSVSSTLPKIDKYFKDAKIYFLVGADVARSIDKWPDGAKLKKRVEIICGNRLPDMGNGRTRFPAIYTNFSHLSSSDIRAKLAVGETAYGLPHAAAVYIKKRGLYIN